jgi:uncharacterized membrane protein YjjP (DUF1212 family)
VEYASLAVTVGVGSDRVTRMCRVGPLSVNETLHRALSDAAARIGQGRFTLTEARAELIHLRQNCPSHPDWFVAVAVGAACAAFGRLLGVDWAGVAPILIASALGQMVRRQLALHHVNVFISATAVAFLGSALCGLGARWAGSQTLATDIIAPVLLLVPGVPAFNAGYDILEGRPTIGGSRAIWVVVMVVFMTVGVWLAQGCFGRKGNGRGCHLKRSRQRRLRQPESSTANTRTAGARSFSASHQGDGNNRLTDALSQ